ncbi:hypothetical protein HDU98_002551 [Podochytrium sp. JEL0797]|nr:hypothetical protein HDU98_002551 [Podochytrium sp. JEL0797]
MHSSILFFAATAATLVLAAPAPVNIVGKCVTLADCPDQTGYICGSGVCIQLPPPGQVGDQCRQFSVAPTICGAGLECVKGTDAGAWFTCQPIV